ncbi:hypothetical protein SAMN04487950_0856 [Halogranum rubrum]|uniref:Uncharacterized protein n=1 Tax=Halogranum rubrum TaxID=553466 RepID=A0A1I4BZ47_9EURY|nr:hypothetical protein [Halogranum rubrum]SFK73965.1 hypothetical protein SAMN04487950_0856 [Halogranum rubrum]
MTRTNLNHSSKLLVACLVLLTAVAAPAAAVSVADSDVPEEAEVGSQVSATVTLDELYKNPQLESWTLQGETNLTDVTWTVTSYDQTGSKLDQQSADGTNMSVDVAAEDDVNEVKVKVTGTVPKVDNYSYDPAQQFLLMSLTQARDGGSSTELETWRAHHYTEESASARETLDSAATAVDSANSQQAEKTFDNAVSAYNNANGPEDFELATELGNEAQSQADSAKQSDETMQLALYAVGGLLVVGVLVGGVLWYRSQQDSYDKLG